MPDIKQIASRLRSTEGQEILEAAIVLPLVFLLLLGIVEFGRAFNIYSTVQQAAQQGAITAARATCGTCGSGNAFPANGSVTGPKGTVAYAVATVMNASSLDPTQIQVSSPSPLSCLDTAKPLKCTIANKITVCRNALLNPPTTTVGPSQCGTIVSFQYPFQFNLPFTSLNMQTIILSAQAQSRMEN